MAFREAHHQVCDGGEVQESQRIEIAALGYGAHGLGGGGVEEDLVPDRERKQSRPRRICESAIGMSSTKTQYIGRMFEKPGW